MGVAGGSADAINKARGYLLSTQEKDGSWSVPPNARFDPIRENVSKSKSCRN